MSSRKLETYEVGNGQKYTVGGTMKSVVNKVIKKKKNMRMICEGRCLSIGSAMHRIICLQELTVVVLEIGIVGSTHGPGIG